MMASLNGEKESMEVKWRSKGSMMRRDGMIKEMSGCFLCGEILMWVVCDSIGLGKRFFHSNEREFVISLRRFGCSCQFKLGEEASSFNPSFLF